MYCRHSNSPWALIKIGQVGDPKLTLMLWCLSHGGWCSNSPSQKNTPSVSQINYPCPCLTRQASMDPISPLLSSPPLRCLFHSFCSKLKSTCFCAATLPRIKFPLCTCHSGVQCLDLVYCLFCPCLYTLYYYPGPSSQTGEAEEVVYVTVHMLHIKLLASTYQPDLPESAWWSTSFPAPQLLDITKYYINC